MIQVEFCNISDTHFLNECLEKLQNAGNEIVSITYCRNSLVTIVFKKGGE